MGRTILEAPEAYTYGMLAATTAGILKQWESGSALSENELSMLKKAESFLQDVLNGHRLASGDRKGFSPTLEGLKAFNYAVSALHTKNHEKDFSKTGELLKRLLNQIREAIKKHGEEAGKRKSPSDATRFFLALSNLLLGEITAPEEQPLAELRMWNT
jgi:hypothetical protein